MCGENGKTRGILVREQKTLVTILRVWDTKDSKTSIRRNAIGARCESGGLRKGSQRCGPFYCAEKREVWGGESNSSGWKSVKVLQADASSLMTRIARLEKRGNLDPPPAYAGKTECYLR